MDCQKEAPLAFCILQHRHYNLKFNGCQLYCTINAPTDTNTVSIQFTWSKKLKLREFFNLKMGKSDMTFIYFIVLVLRAILRVIQSFMQRASFFFFFSPQIKILNYVIYSWVKAFTFKHYQDTTNIENTIFFKKIICTLNYLYTISYLSYIYIYI